MNRKTGGELGGEMESLSEERVVFTRALRWGEVEYV